MSLQVVIKFKLMLCIPFCVMFYRYLHLHRRPRNTVPSTIKSYIFYGYLNDCSSYLFITLPGKVCQGDLSPNVKHHLLLYFWSIWVVYKYKIPNEGIPKSGRSSKKNRVYSINNIVKKILTIIQHEILYWQQP